MTNVAALGIKASTDGVDTSVDQLNALAGAADKAETATDKLAPSTKRAGAAAEEMGGSVKTAEGALSRLASRAGTVAGSLAAMAASALSVTAYIQLADKWSDLRSQLGAATGDMAGAGDMMQRLVGIANASYSPLDQTVQVYARNVSVLRDLGKSSGDAADFTESLNNMLVITATRGERAASVQDALSKAMAVGALQADGLETILANGGRVAQALADELGTTVSGLRALASEGAITGQVIADAIIKPLDDVRVAAAEMPATVADAFTRIGTNLLSLVGQFDQATGASAALANSLIWFADNLPMFADGLAYLGVVAVGLAATQIPAMIASLVASVAAFGAAATAAGIATAAMTALSTVMSFLGGPIGIAVGAIAALGAAYFLTTTRATNLGGASREMNTALQQVPGYADGAAGGLGRSGTAAYDAAGQFDDFTGAVGAARTALQMWFDDYMAATKLPPITSPLTGITISPPGEIENFLGTGGGTGLAPTNSPRPRGAPALLGEPDLPRNGGGGGGGGGATSGLQGLISELQTERELLTVWYEEKLGLIQSYSDRELEAIGGRHGALERLEAEHQERLRALGSDYQNQRLQDAAGFFGGMADLARSGGERTVKVAQALAATQGVINSYLAFTEVLKDPAFIGRPWARAGAAAAALSQGLAAVRAIKGASSSGGGGGGVSSAGGTKGASAQPSSPEAPLRATLDAINPTALYSGGALISLFEAIQKEAGNRGIIWVPNGGGA